MAKLVLIRHGQSEWNAKGLWTGWTDIGLSDKGKEEAKKAGELIKDIHFSVAFVSDLIRAQETLQNIQKVLGTHLTPIITSAIKERNYGDYTGKNKWELEKEFGEEKFLAIRRGWDESVPNGETLKDVYDRVIPYYQATILPYLEKGENVLISAHGNSLRALVKYLDNLSDQQVTELEIATGEVIVYDIDSTGKVTSKEIRTVHE